MAGYRGYSMSNNAAEAYDCGKMPNSKWTKKAILNAVAAAAGEKTAAMFEDFKTADLREHLLRYSGWHHTSKRFNKTDFYELRDLTNDESIADALGDLCDCRKARESDEDFSKRKEAATVRRKNKKTERETAAAFAAGKKEAGDARLRANSSAEALAFLAEIDPLRCRTWVFNRLYTYESAVRAQLINLNPGDAATAGEKRIRRTQNAYILDVYDGKIWRGEDGEIFSF